MIQLDCIASMQARITGLLTDASSQQGMRNRCATLASELT
jgi:hypothetical protein